MCGRYLISTPAETIVDLFHAMGPIPNLRPRYNAAPTDPLPVVLRDDKGGERRLEQLRWGLIPYWAKDVRSIRHPDRTAMAAEIFARCVHRFRNTDRSPLPQLRKSHWFAEIGR